MRNQLKKILSIISAMVIILSGSITAFSMNADEWKSYWESEKNGRIEEC